MKDKDVPKGGERPPEIEKPKISNEDKPIFSFYDLAFIDSYKDDKNRKMVTFFVGGDNPFYIECFLSEYFDFFQTVLELREQALLEGKECLCDSCSPEFTKVADWDTDFVKMVEGKQQEESTKPIPLYLVWNLVESVKVSIHSNHEEDVQ